MADLDITQRLDAIISILKLAHSGALAEVRASVLGDPVNAAILEATSEVYVASGTLKQSVATLTEQSGKTVQRRIGDLAAMGALEKRPTGRPAYRSTGII